jgi:hypothetical protein
LVKNRFGIAAHSNVFYDTSARQGNRQKLTQGEYERLDGIYPAYGRSHLVRNVVNRDGLTAFTWLTTSDLV